MKLLWSIVVFLMALPGYAGEEPAQKIVGKPLNFEEALKIIVDRSTSVTTQQGILSQTEARNYSSHLRLLPTATGTVSNANTLGTGSLGVDNSYTAQGTVNLNVFHFGSDVAAMKAANAEEDQNKLLVTNAVITTEAAGVNALVTTVQATQEVRILNQIVDMQTSSYQIALERYRRGLLPSQEADKVAIDLDNARAALRDAEIAARSAEANLAALLGHSNIALDWPWKKRVQDAFDLLIKSNEAQLTDRPDWIAAKRRIDGVEERIKERWGMMLPSLDAQFSYGYLNDVTAGNRGPNWAGSITLTIPLFDRLASYGEYQSHIAHRVISEAAFEQVKRQAKNDFQAAKSAFQISLESAKDRDKTLTTSRRLYQDNLLRFRSGLVSANDLIVDQRRLFATELNAIKGWGAVHVNFSNLCHALGKTIEDCDQRAE
jgi:outer membrane protein TolC